MSDDPDNIVLALLRAIRGDIGLLREDMADVRRRMTTLETQIGSFIATEQSHYAQAMLRMDRFGDRLERIEKRLDLSDAPA
jgi:hypothetical protein